MVQLRYVICGTLFTVSSLTAFVAISLPDWVISESPPNSHAGAAQLGLVRSCVHIAFAPSSTCYWEEVVARQWKFALYCIVIASITLMCAGMLCFVKQTPSGLSVGRSLGLFALVFLCCAIISLPAGFHSGTIGGSPFHLPPTCRVGSAYWMVIIVTSVLLFLEVVVSCCFSNDN